MMAAHFSPCVVVVVVLPQLSQAVGEFGAACEGLLIKHRKNIIRKSTLCIVCYYCYYVCLLDTNSPTTETQHIVSLSNT